jgi:hypothetical protein
MSHCSGIKYGWFVCCEWWGTSDCISVDYFINFCFLTRPSLSGAGWFPVLASTHVVFAGGLILVAGCFVATVQTGMFFNYAVYVCVAVSAMILCTHIFLFSSPAGRLIALKRSSTCCSNLLKRLNNSVSNLLSLLLLLLFAVVAVCRCCCHEVCQKFELLCCQTIARLLAVFLHLEAA